ncbi:hypothetical protein QUF51_15200 [Bacillus pumilus]|nr:hypothetical protein [Bacillus pumilus]OLP65261.1 hypothetical protein BACPU_17960 [Bacillus pumilus]
MNKVSQSFSSGFTLAVFYVFVVFMIPILWLFLEINDVESSPTLFGMPFYIMKIEKNQFSSEATIFGFLVCFFAGVLLYMLIQYVLYAVRRKSLKKQTNKKSICLENE